MVLGRVNIDIPVVSAPNSSVVVVEPQPDTPLDSLGVLVTEVYRVTLSAILVQLAAYRSMVCNEQGVTSSSEYALCSDTPRIPTFVIFSKTL